MDDLIILTRTPWQLKRAVATMNQWFADAGLEQHPDKTFIGRLNHGFDWLGYRFNKFGILSKLIGLIMNLSKISRFSMLSLLILYSSASQSADGKMPADLVIEDFPLSQCYDKNAWAWYRCGENCRYAKCGLHKNAEGKKHVVEMRKGYYREYIRLVGTSDKVQYGNPPTHFTHLYGELKSCNTAGKNWWDDTRVLASKCIDTILKNKKSRQALYNLHGVRPSYKKRTGKDG